MFFEAPRDLVAVSPATQAKTLAQLQTLGVKALRVELTGAMSRPASTAPHKPNFDATNPASYNWSAYDELLFAAKRLNWPVLLTVTSPVPEWATAGHDDKNLVTRPDDKDFKEFMTAVALHYAGMVSLYAIWNEPNHPQFLRPQFNIQRHARIAADLSRPVSGGLRRSARGGNRQTEDAHGGNGAGRAMTR